MKKKQYTHILLSILYSGFFFFLFIYTGQTGHQISQRQDRMLKDTPDIVMLGNSLLRAGVDIKDFSRQTGLRTHRSYSNGSASAWWYLCVKNVLCETSPSPRYAFIFFRDHFLTDPAFRTIGVYRRPIRQLSHKKEPVLYQTISNYGQMTSKTWAIDEAKAWWERRIKKITRGLLGLSPGVIQSSLQEVFHEKNMQGDKFHQQQLNSEIASSIDLFDFNQKYPKSFLPEMISLAKEKGIQLVFVRLKRRYSEEAPYLTKYMNDLKELLARHQVKLLDFSKEPSIKEEHFGSGDHLNIEGKELFTKLLSAEVNVLFRKKLL